MKKCPRCKLPQESTEECQYCGLVFEKPEINAKRIKNKAKVRSKKPYIILTIVLVVLAAGFIFYKYAVAPYVEKRAEEKRRQDILKAEKLDKQKCYEAYKALKKIEAYLETGVNFLDFSKAVRDANYQLNLLEDVSPVATKLRHVYEIYNSIKEIWYYDNIYSDWNSGILYYKSVEKSANLLPTLKELWKNKKISYSKRSTAMNFYDNAKILLLMVAQKELRECKP